MKKTIFLLVIFFVTISTCNAGQTTTTKSGWIAGVSKESFSRAFDCVLANDAECLQKYLDAGTVIIMKGGLKVQVVESNFMGSIVKIRPIGTTRYLWTVSEALN
jgi:hypothetical protein